MLATPVLGFAVPARAALLAPCAISRRCVPPIARENPEEHWVEFDESGDECVVSNAGSSCMEADVAGPVRIDQIDDQRRSRFPQDGARRSPGFQGLSSTNDFKKPFDGSARGNPAPQEPRADVEPARTPPQERPRSSPGFIGFQDRSTHEMPLIADELIADELRAATSAFAPQELVPSRASDAKPPARQAPNHRWSGTSFPYFSPGSLR